MDLQSYLVECYSPQDLRDIARKMGLHDGGRREVVAARITKGFTEWLPPCMIGEVLSRLSDRAKAKELKKISARLTGIIDDSKYGLFVGIARNIPELTSKAQDWLLPPHLRYFLMECYSKNGLKGIARMMEFDTYGSTHTLVERISSGMELTAREEDSKKILAKLLKEANDGRLRAFCEEIGLPSGGSKKRVFTNLSRSLLGLERVAKPEYYKRAKAALCGVPVPSGVSGESVPEDIYPR